MDGFDALSDGQWRQMVGRFIDLMDIHDGSDVIEIECGSGEFLHLIDTAGSLSGIDYSEAAIAQIQSRLQGDFRLAEASHLPFEDDSLDLVLSFSIFQYFGTLDYALRALNEEKSAANPEFHIRWRRH